MGFGSGYGAGRGAGKFSGKKCRLVSMFALTSAFFVVEIVTGKKNTGMGEKDPRPPCEKCLLAKRGLSPFPIEMFLYLPFSAITSWTIILKQFFHYIIKDDIW